MSQEWLKKLAELSNDKELVKRAEQFQQKAAQRAAMRRTQPAAPRRRSLLGAAVGHFFRFLFLIALVQAAAMVLVAAAEGLENEPWGVIFHYLVWYPLTQPIFPSEFYALLHDWTGLTRGDLGAFYEQINESLGMHQDSLVYVVPAVASLALTLFFLPSINAGRRRSPIRGLVYLANLAVVFLLGGMGPGVLVIWLAALLFSFAGGRAAKPERAKALSQAERVARPVPAAASTAAAIVQRAASPVTGARREPTVVRRSDSPSWVRAR